MNAGAFPWLVLEDVLSAMIDGSIVIDPMDTFVDEQQKDAVVAVTENDLVVLNADVQRDPDGEIGWIGKADVTGVRMLDEAGNPIAMTRSRDVLELDEPEHSYVVAIDRRARESTMADAFVFRSLSVADEARRDFERNLPTIA